jgi:hypothetical protein
MMDEVTDPLAGLFSPSTRCDEPWPPADALEVPGWPNYFVCPDGRVHSIHRRRWGVLAVQRCRAGYQKVCLWRKQERWPVRVHTLVAHVFIGPRPDGMYVCHKDDNPENNHISNLYYGTPAENARDRENNRRQTCKHYNGSKKVMIPTADGMH